MGEVVSGPGSRTCSRAGCAWPASATLSFDYDRRQSWIDDLAAVRDLAAYDLCDVHADRFRPPLGWLNEDRRRLPERIFVVPGEVIDLPDQKSLLEGTSGGVALPEI